MDYPQFSIYTVNLNPTRGSEQSGIRPCLILQTNAVSDVGKTTIIAVFTTKKLEKIYPHEVFIKKDADNWLTSDSKVKLNQIRVIDKQRIGEKIGSIRDQKQISQILWAMDIIFDRPWNFR